MKPHIVILALVALLAGCASPQAAPTPIIQTVVVTEIVQAPTPTPYPTFTPIPSQTPYPTYTPAPPVIVMTTTSLPQTPTPAPSATIVAAAISSQPPTPVPTASVQSDSYASFIKCIGGADVTKYITRYNPQEILDAAKRDQYLYKNDDECLAAVLADINSLKATANCVAALGEPADPDLKAMRAATLDGFGNLFTIRETLLGRRMCGVFSDPYALDRAAADTKLMGEAKSAYLGVVQTFTAVQSLLDKYRR